MTNAETGMLYAAGFIMIFGGLFCTFIFSKVIDRCARPGEQQRVSELAVTRNSCKQVRQLTLQTLFPPDKIHRTDQSARDKEASPGDHDTCAICLEPFNDSDHVMEGIVCHHEYHRTCMMEWLDQHDDCPVCRKPMWTLDSYFQAKKRLFRDQPGTLEMELTAVAAEDHEATLANAVQGDFEATAPPIAAELELSNEERDIPDINGIDLEARAYEGTNGSDIVELISCSEQQL